MKPSAQESILEVWRYERLLRYHGETFRRLGYRLCAPLPGWSGWDSWVLVHRATGRLRPAPDPHRLEKAILRLEARWQRRSRPA